MCDLMFGIERPGSPPGDYGQVVPQKETSHSPRHSHPPILPAHLLQVILNKEIPQHVRLFLSVSLLLILPFVMLCARTVFDFSFSRCHLVS